MCERLKQQASKSCIPKGIEGSNPSLSEKLESTLWVLFNFLDGGKQTALLSVGIWSPERCASFAEGKGEHREGRGGGKFRQEFYRNPNPSLSAIWKPQRFALGFSNDRKWSDLNCFKSRQVLNCAFILLFKKQYLAQKSYIKIGLLALVIIHT